MSSNKSHILHDISLTILILTASTFLGVLFRMLDFHETNVVVVFIFFCFADLPGNQRICLRYMRLGYLSSVVQLVLHQAVLHIESE